jgi:hypothetical protein
MLRLVSYAITPILAIILRKYEIPLTVALLPILLAVLYKRPERQIVLGFLIGVAMATLEYICIRFGMWQYFRVQNTIPMWLPILWTLVVLFVVDIFQRFAV